MTQKNKITHRYLIDNNLEVFVNPCSNTMHNRNFIFEIHSMFKKNTSGMGEGQYYNNTLIGKEIISDDDFIFEINGITATSSLKESWMAKAGKSQYFVAITAILKDKLGDEKMMVFSQKSYNNKIDERFCEMFEYIRVLNTVGTHVAMDFIVEKEKKIRKLERTLEKINKTMP